MDRQTWLAVRDSGSLGQFLRGRGRFLHISKPHNPAMRANHWTFFGSRRTEPGRTYDIGRNAAKRAAKAAS